MKKKVLLWMIGIFILIEIILFALISMHNAFVDRQAGYYINNIISAQLDSDNIFNNIDNNMNHINYLSNFTKNELDSSVLKYADGTDNKRQEVCKVANKTLSSYSSNYDKLYTNITNCEQISDIQKFKENTELLWNSTQTEKNPWSAVFGKTKEESEKEYNNIICNLNFIKKQLEDKQAALAQLKQQEMKEEPPKLSEMEIVMQDNSPLGNRGRLYVPSVGINVALNGSFNPRDNAESQAENQYYTDLPDSATFAQHGVQWYIGDHNYQGFDRIAEIQVGTKIYIKHTDYTISTYVCVDGDYAINDGHNFIYHGQDGTKLNAGGVFLYTCCGADWHNIIARLFQPC